MGTIQEALQIKALSGAETWSQVNAGVELKPGPSPAPEGDPVQGGKAESTSSASNKMCKFRMKHLGRFLKTRMGISASSRERAVGCNKSPQEE